MHDERWQGAMIDEHEDKAGEEGGTWEHRESEWVHTQGGGENVSAYVRETGTGADRLRVWRDQRAEDGRGNVDNHTNGREYIVL